jgi:signal transduction histidine kinase
VRLDNRSPSPHCVTDIQLLGIILSNLIDNALKYSLANSVVTITVETRQRHGKAGMGIEVANLPGAAGMPDPAQLFRKYYRAPGAHAKTGSGLGLHVAEGFARKLGGELRFCPTNETVRFALWIPL